jgi:hypothetical protein
MTNNKQQTAVEWIIKQLIFKTEFENLPNQYVLMSDKNIDNIIEQAKEMEKEQIISIYKEGHYHLELDSFNPEQYYEQTYGGGEQ